MSNNALTLQGNQLPADRNPLAVYLASLESQTSRRTMASAAREITRIVTGDPAHPLNWAALRFQHTAAIRTALAEQHSPATANKILSCLRGILKAARDLGELPERDYTRAVSIKAVKGTTLPRGRALTSGEISGLLNACHKDRTPAGVRDGALVALAYACGLRRAELAGLQLDAFDNEAETLKVRGKRNKERSVPVTGGAAEALRDWIGTRGSEPGPLFCPITKGGKIEQRQMNSQAIYDALRKRAAEAEIKQLSPHDFRRTFVSDLLDQGADISTVQQLAGHSSPQTTARYDRRGEAAKRKAVNLLHVPYQSRKPVN